jgi:deoxyribose-phosphate aldolase
LRIAQFIDHTALKPDTSEEQIYQLCAEAKEHGFAAVCVNPTWVNLCKRLLSDTKVGVCAVIGFPLGASMPETKAFEARETIVAGATEVDMVLNIGALKSGNINRVEYDMRSVREATLGTTLKVIIETCLLTDKEKVLACELASKVGADFVKTSTGFSSGGATADDVRLMRKTVGNIMGVKASGGIRDYATAKAMINAGANRLGCSASVAIVSDVESKAVKV